MKKFLSIALALLVSAGAFAQTTCKSDVVQNQYGHSVPQATIYIGLNTCTGTPCTPLAQLYSDVGLTSPITQPITTDNMGKFAFCVAAPGRFTEQVTFNSLTTTDTKYIVAPGDTVPGVWVSPPFTDDGSTSGTFGLITIPRNATITGVHLRAVKPWTACSSSPSVAVYGHPQNTGESAHLFATLTVQGGVHPSGQTSQHYFTNSDLTNLAVAVLAGDELKLQWSPASGCSAYGDGIIVSINYEGSR